MTSIRKVVLDVLKPHAPDITLLGPEAQVRGMMSFRVGQGIG